MSLLLFKNIKLLCQEITEPLYLIINQMRDTGIFPDANIITIHKTMT